MPKNWVFSLFGRFGLLGYTTGFRFLFDSVRGQNYAFIKSSSVQISGHILYLQEAKNRVLLKKSLKTHFHQFFENCLILAL